MLPVIDLREADVPARIEAACTSTGFFYVSGHGVSLALQSSLDISAREFFGLPEFVKQEIEMARGGPAWRGWFPVGAELTSGEADLKEGLYFGTELPAGHPLPLHGPNLFPRQVPALRPIVLAYLDELTRVAQEVLRGVALSLDLAPDYFSAGYTANPTVLFRIFHYPPADGPGWGVGEHTDYGLLTLLLQDDNGGAGAHARRLGGRATGAGHVRVQHRRHAGTADERVVPVHPAPSPQHLGTGPVVVPVLLRPGLLLTGAAAAAPRRGRTRRAAALGRAVTARVRGHVRGVPDRESGQGVPATSWQPSGRGERLIYRGRVS